MLAVQETIRYDRRATTLEITLVDCRLQWAIDCIVQSEWRRFRSRLGTLTHEQQLTIQQSMRDLANKILDPPIRRLKRATRL